MTKTRSLLSACLVTAALVLLAAPAVAAPGNDDVTEATVVNTLPLDANIDTRNATNEEFESTLPEGCEGGPGVWYRIDLDEAVSALVFLDGETPAVGGLYQEQDGNPGALLACFKSPDGKAGSSDGNLYTFEAHANYYLRLATEGADATGVFGIRIGTALGIRGTVTSSSGTPIPRTLIWAHDQRQRRIAAACSYPDGKFRVSGLPAGTYRLRATASTCSIPEGGPNAVEGVEKGRALWYRNATSFEDAKDVVVTDDDVTGIEIVFSDGKTASEPKASNTPPPASASPSSSPSPSASASASATPSATPSVEGALAGSKDEGTPWVAPVIVLLLLVPMGTFAYHRWWRARATKAG